MSDPRCTSCGDKGWLHMTDSCSRGPAIETCDCGKLYPEPHLADDDIARERHAKDCGCGWGTLACKDEDGKPCCDEATRGEPHSAECNQAERDFWAGAL